MGEFFAIVSYHANNSTSLTCPYPYSGSETLGNVSGQTLLFVWFFWIEQCAIWLYDNRVMPVGGPSHFGTAPTQPSHPLDRLEASLDHPDGEGRVMRRSLECFDQLYPVPMKGGSKSGFVIQIFCLFINSQCLHSLQPLPSIDSSDLKNTEQSGLERKNSDFQKIITLLCYISWYFWVSKYSTGW